MVEAADIFLGVIKYGILAAGVILLADAMGLNPLKFKLSKLDAVVLGAPLLSTGLVAIALTRK